MTSLSPAQDFAVCLALWLLIVIGRVGLGARNRRQTRAFSSKHGQRPREPWT